jgi:hypothetical protein
MRVHVITVRVHVCVRVRSPRPNCARACVAVWCRIDLGSPAVSRVLRKCRLLHAVLRVIPQCWVHFPVRCKRGVRCVCVPCHHVTSRRCALQDRLFDAITIGVFLLLAHRPASGAAVGSGARVGHCVSALEMMALSDDGTGDWFGAWALGAHSRVQLFRYAVQTVRPPTSNTARHARGA